MKEEKNTGWNFVKAPRDVIFDEELSAQAKILYLALLDHLRANESCFPSIDTLKSLVGCSAASLHKYKDELKAKGLIEWTHRKTLAGIQNIYTMPRAKPVVKNTTYKTSKVSEETKEFMEEWKCMYENFEGVEYISQAGDYDILKNLQKHKDDILCYWEGFVRQSGNEWLQGKDNSRNLKVLNKMMQTFTAYVANKDKKPTERKSSPHYKKDADAE